MKPLALIKLEQFFSMSLSLILGSLFYYFGILEFHKINENNI